VSLFVPSDFNPIFADVADIENPEHSQSPKNVGKVDKVKLNLLADVLDDMEEQEPNRCSDASINKSVEGPLLVQSKSEQVAMQSQLNLLQSKSQIVISNTGLVHPKSQELLPTEPRQRGNSMPTLRPSKADKNNLAEEHVRRVIDGKDMLSKFA